MSEKRKQKKRKHFSHIQCSGWGGAGIRPGFAGRDNVRRIAESDAEFGHVDQDSQEYGFFSLMDENWVPDESWPQIGHAQAGQFEEADSGFSKRDDTMETERV